MGSTCERNNICRQEGCDLFLVAVVFVQRSPCWVAHLTALIAGGRCPNVKWTLLSSQ